tara:strand:+ start:277 stop:513 length:237 start_codon:yes stop_codon:yes gene_type:complete
MAWTTITKSVRTGFLGWQYETAAAAAQTYPDASGSYSGGIRTFTTPGPSANQQTYVRCRKVGETVERGELSKTYYDAQ